MGNMATVDAQRFASAWLSSKTVAEVCKKMDVMNERGVLRRRRRVETELGITLPPFSQETTSNFPEHHNETFTVEKDALIVIGGDKHHLPGHRPQAFNAFLHFIEDTKPDYVVVIGDWFDFPAIGRFHRIGWQAQPSVKDELESGVADLTAVRDASPKSKRIFCLGNHDMRFDGILSNRLSETEGVAGHRLSDHINVFSKLDYQICLSAVFNDHFIVKHRWHSGVHSSYNDVLRGGKNIATGHDHKLNVRPWTDYNGTRYGIKTGCLSDLWDEAFLYLENNATDWQPGFAAVTISGGIIIPQAVPIVLDKNHAKRGKAHYHGKWYG